MKGGGVGDHRPLYKDKDIKQRKSCSIKCSLRCCTSETLTKESESFYINLNSKVVQQST